eukprot:10733304-Ditylum_brightwellii.AAC.1
MIMFFTIAVWLALLSFMMLRDREKAKAKFLLILFIQIIVEANTNAGKPFFKPPCPARQETPLLSTSLHRNMASKEAGMQLPSLSIRQ